MNVMMKSDSSLCELLKRDFPRHYQKQYSAISDSANVPCKKVEENLFELKDEEDNCVVEEGNGNVRYVNSGSEPVFVVHYEQYINQFPSRFLQNRKKCDFLLFDQAGSFIILNELTISKSEANLSKQDQHTGLSKSERAEKQLINSLNDLREVDSINQWIEKRERKICLFAYKIPESSRPEINNARLAFNRPLLNEAKETQGVGAELSSKEIEDFGFRYFRLCYPHPLHL
jgi:hypothetical protein